MSPCSFVASSGTRTLHGIPLHIPTEYFGSGLTISKPRGSERAPQVQNLTVRLGSVRPDTNSWNPLSKCVGSSTKGFFSRRFFKSGKYHGSVRCGSVITFFRRIGSVPGSRV